LNEVKEVSVENVELIWNKKQNLIVINSLHSKWLDKLLWLYKLFAKRFNSFKKLYFTINKFNLRGANLSRARLNEADLSEVNVRYARFANNVGISEALKIELINKGAIFDDSRGDRSGMLTPV
jgi:uncharacterized protein YjbI with pentapeptide repeats